MRCKALRCISPLVIGFLTFATNLPAQSNLSHVRVVRLSYVSGTVGVKRPASSEWAKAQVNTPLQEGFQLSTAGNSYAEVEFENGSTARLGEFSKLSFDQLAIDADGNKLNRLSFEQGYATFHFLPEHHDAYGVKIAETTLTPNGKTVFRTDLTKDRLRVEVFAGSVEVAAPSGTSKLGKEKVAEFDPSAKQELALNETHGIVKDQWDKWTSERDTQAQLALNDQAVPARGVAYGWSDLDAYGEWAFFPGFGYGWSPFAGLGWAPYSMGMWGWYPGMGYTWISGEPWGWLPYHYGGWNFAPNFGWFWTPGSMAYFSPALVNWYSGAGWIGWSPLGVQGAAGIRTVASVPGSSIHIGEAIGPNNVIQLPATAGTMISRMAAPGAGSTLVGPRLALAGTTFASAAATSHSMAPRSVLMAGDARAEQSLLAGRSFHQPLRARMGTTLGGHYSVGGTVGEFHGDAFRGPGAAQMPHGMNGPAFSRGSGMAGPTIMPHGQQSAMTSRGAGGMAPSAGSGVSSMSSAGPSAVSAGPSMSGGGHAGGSGGGHH